MKKLGTHAGNDAIVAFAKLHNVNIMIHQLGGKPLLVCKYCFYILEKMLLMERDVYACMDILLINSYKSLFITSTNIGLLFFFYRFHYIFYSQIQGQATGGANIKQLHIAYHNFDHYSSVRRLNDNTESPANIRIQVKNNSSFCRFLIFGWFALLDINW